MINSASPVHYCLYVLESSRETPKKQAAVVRLRQMCYTIYTTHGRGGGRKEGAKAIRLADMASIVDADIYIHSHAFTNDYETGIL